MQDAGCRRLHVHVHLVGREHVGALPFLDPRSGRYEPFGKLALLHLGCRLGDAHLHHHRRTSRTDSAIVDASGVWSCASDGAKGTGVEAVATRRTGRSSCPNSSSWIIADISAPGPAKRAAACVTTARRVLATDVSTVC